MKNKLKLQHKVKEILENVIGPKLLVDTAETALWDKSNLNGIISFENDPTGSQLVARHHIVYEFYANCNLKSLRENMKKQLGSHYELTPVILNEWSVYFFDEKRENISYRGHVVGIYLKELITSLDDISQKKCCQRISQIYFDQERTRFCLKLESDQAFWTLCKENLVEIKDFRQKLLQFILQDDNILIEYDPNSHPLIDDSNMGWNWVNQQNWKGQCIQGLNQSPLELSQVQIEEEQGFNLEWNFEPNEQKLPQVIYDGHEYVINGDFGTFIFQNTKCNCGPQKFKAIQLSLKKNPEHFTQQNGDVEMQVKCENDQDKSVAILSFILKEKELEQQNKFFDQLNPFTWQLNKDFKQQYTTVLNLNDMVEGGAKQFYNKSFYFYWGSESRPPCAENVRRIVFEHPIYITDLQMKEIKQAVSIKGGSLNVGNFRQSQKIGTRQVFHTKDTKTKCAGYVNWPYNVSEQVNAMNSKEKQQFEDENLTTVTKYKLMKEKPLIDEVGNIRTQIVDADEIDDDSMKQLLEGEQLTPEEIKTNQIRQQFYKNDQKFE